MKAKDLLNWVVDFNLNGEDLFSVEISESDEFESQSDFIEKFFGCIPDKEIPAGGYIYIWSDVLPYEFYDKKLEQKAEIALKAHEDYKIYLFRIED